MKTEAAILTEAVEALDRGDADRALRTIAAEVGEFQTPTDGNWGFTAGFPRLDAFCQRLGRSLLPAIAAAGPPDRNHASLDVYVASEIYAIGGHTALIGDYKMQRPGRPARLLVSNHLNRRNPAPPAAVTRTGLTPEAVEVCPVMGLADKVRWLMQRLTELRPIRIFLLNHPEDPTPVAAAQPAPARWIYFVHHADHSPALGLHLPCHGHLDVTPRATACCRNFLGIERAVYVPLGCAEPVEAWRPRVPSTAKGGQCFQPVLAPPVSARPADAQPCRGQAGSADPPATPLATASSGSMNKFSFQGPLAYPDVITTLLARTAVRHIHFGPLPREVGDQWPRQLAARGIDPARLVHVPRVESLRQAMTDFGIDLYLNSFPSPGARSSIEVMCSGTPILQHQGGLNPSARAMQLVYPEAAWWSTPDELVARVREAEAPWLAAQQVLARRHFERFHAAAVIAPLFEKDPIAGATPPKLGEPALTLQQSRISGFQERWLG